MSVVVRMEMPKRCAECPLSCQMYGDTPCYCKMAFEENEAVEGGLMWKETDPTKRPSWCPIICSLPEGHGRLVDEKEVKDWVENWLCVNKYYHPYSSSKSIPMSELYDVLQRMDAAVPAERSET